MVTGESLSAEILRTVEDVCKGLNDHVGVGMGWGQVGSINYRSQWGQRIVEGGLLGSSDQRTRCLKLGD